MNIEITLNDGTKLLTSWDATQEQSIAEFYRNLINSNSIKSYRLI